MSYLIFANLFSRSMIMPARTIIFNLILLLLITQSVPAQKFVTFETWDTDSLLSALSGLKGKERVLTLNRLTISLFFRDCPLSLKYADSAMTLASQLKYDEGMAEAFRNYGHIYQYMGNYPASLRNYMEALAYYERLGNLHEVMMRYYDIAKTHFFARDYGTTIRYGLLAMELYRRPVKGGGTVGTVRDSVIIKGGMAQAYVPMGKYADALKFQKEVLELANRYHFPAVERLMTTWVVGATSCAAEEYDSAGKYLQQALSFPNENIAITAQKYRVREWLAHLFDASGNKDSAALYYRKSYEWYKEHGLFFWAMYASNFLGRLYYRMDDLDRAEKWYKSSETMLNAILEEDSWYRDESFKSIPVYGFEYYWPLPLSEMRYMTWDHGEWLYHGLFRIYQKKNNVAKALKYHILYTAAGDTLQKMLQQRETMEMQIRFDTENQEKQIKSLSSENEIKTYKLRQTKIILFGLAGFVLLIALLAFLLIRHYRLNEMQNTLILRHKLFRSQMNPHFIFNSLSGIHHFILHEPPSKAASYLTRFSKLIRAILRSSIEDYISLSEERSTIENYLELQKIRFPDKFSFTVEMDEALDPENTFIPCMIIQPFVENAIEHGIKHLNAEGQISVRFSRKNTMVLIEVKDDGIGRTKAREYTLNQDKDHQSLSTSLILERINSLNKTLKQKITLDIRDLVNDQGEPAGTEVTLLVPLQ